MKYRDKVRIKSGFFEGSIGVVIDETVNMMFSSIIYTVEFISNINGTLIRKSIDFNVNCLEKIEK